MTSTGGRYAVNVISAVTPQGKLRFSTFTGTLDTEIFVSFCRRLLHDTPGPVFLIVDGHPVHRPRAVITFRIHRPAPTAVLPPALLAQAQPRRIGVEKRQTRRIGKAGVRSAEDLRHKAENALCRLQRPPNLVRAFFLNPHTRYAHAV